MAIPGAVGLAGGVLLTATEIESMLSQSVGQWWTSARRSAADLHCRPGDGRALTRRSLAGVKGPDSPRVIVVAARLIIVGVGVAGVIKGMHKSFTEEIDMSSMSPASREGVARLGQVGQHRQGGGSGVGGGSTQLCSPDLRAAEGAGTGRRPPNDPGAAVREASPHSRGARILGFRPVRAILQSRYRRM
jgi:hypothetical protein